ncbi:MAG: hypothetical protein P8R54_17885 [Myxococcota bacterium]|nr:hypothetical protein [Myxococcota bacterium]
MSSPSPPGDALQRCAEISDVILAGDCALVVVAQVDEPGLLCGAVPDGMWREECWFLAAEASNRTGDAMGAAALCQKSGRFALDCAQHLWQTPVHGLIHGPGARAFAVILPKAEALYAAWAPLMVEETDFEERFWSKFFGNGFEGQGEPIDLGWCSTLPTNRQGACAAAGVAHYAREVGPSVERAGGLEAMCALVAPDVASLSRWINAVSDPRLDTEAARRVVEICTTHPHRQRR